MKQMEQTEEDIADAVQGNWVDLYAPPQLRPYLRLSRADRPIGTWLLLLPCWWGLGLAILIDTQFRLEDIWIFLGCGIGACLMRGAGCTWNDITDRDFDGAVERTRNRPLPSGQVSVRQALCWMALQALLASLILFSFNTSAILLGFVSLVPVVVYPFAKRFTWWPQVFLGLAFNWGALLAFAAHFGTLHPASLLLYLSGISWTLFYDTIYAHQDKEDDALIGIKSTARLFGEQTHRWLAFFALLSVALMGASLMWVASGTALIIASAGVVAFGGHLLWQLLRLETEDQDRLLALFRSNRDAGLFVTGFFFLACVL